MRTRYLVLTAIVLAMVTAGFAQSGSGIRRVDFKNYNYGALCGGPHKFLALDPGRLVLKNGRQGDDFDYNKLESVQYADLNADGKDDAFVRVRGQTSGSSNGYLSAYVFTFQVGRAKQLWSKCEEGSTAELKGKTVQFRSPEWLKNDAHCCFSNILTATYGWKAGKFTLLSSRRTKTFNERAESDGETIEGLAARVSAAFGDLGSLDAGKPYSGRVSVVIEHSIAGGTETRSFATLKQAEIWISRRRPDAGRNAGAVKRCRRGVCTFAQEGMLHNNIYLTKIAYTLAGKRPVLKTIYIIDGD